MLPDPQAALPSPGACPELYLFHGGADHDDDNLTFECYEMPDAVLSALSHSVLTQPCEVRSAELPI